MSTHVPPAPASNPWLGDDLATWSQSIRNGYVRAFIIFALHETGVFQMLRSRGAMSAAELGDALGLNTHLLDGVLNFLVHADLVLAKDGDRFMLTERGEWLFADSVLAMSFGAVGAYASILYELVPCLRNEKRYGVDFVRPGDLLAKGSYYTGKGNYDWVVGQLKALDVTRVADLGCGLGDVLVGFCKLDADLKGVGIDIVPGALAVAGARARDEGLADRITLLEGDVTRPESYAEAVADVGAFHGLMVFHEFLRDGEEAVVNLLRRMKALFPGRYLIVGEFDRLSDGEFQAMPFQERIHPLFYQYVIHPLTWQGLPMEKDRWLRLFERAGLTLVAMEDRFKFRLVEYVLQM